MSLILLWLNNHMTVPFCFITLGWTNMIIRQLDKFLVLVILLKSMEISGFSTKSVKKFRLVCYIAKPFCFRYDIVPKGHCAWTGLYPDGWSEFCSKELAGLRELKIPPALAAIILAAGVGRRDKTIDTREACRVSACGGGHGGIEEEDRALSYLSAHVLWAHHLHECVGVFVFLRVLSIFRFTSFILPCAEVRRSWELGE